MAQTVTLPRMNRRNFLLAAGAAAAVSLVSGYTPLAFKLGGNHLSLDRSLKVGVLTPDSPLYPFMGTNLLAGMQLLFNKVTGGAIEVVAERIGLGSALARQKSVKLVRQDGVDVVVGLMNTEVAAAIQHVFPDAQVPFIVSNVGANLAHPNSQNAYVFHNTLAYWQANWALGQWAYQTQGHRAFVAASLYESGFDSVYAFGHGFAAAGGEIVHTHISPDRDDHDFASLAAKIEQARPDFVFALYNGPQAVEFVQAYAGAGLDRHFPLLTAAFTVDESLLPAQQPAACDAHSCFSWAASLDTPENQAFTAAYQKMTGRTADAFAVLGYDTARLIVEAVRLAAARSGAALAAALEQVSFVGPRGSLIIDPATHTAVTPLYVRRTQLAGSRLQNVVTAQLEPIRSWQGELPGLKTGWLNPYLCV